jgi:hypothetical protein
MIEPKWKHPATRSYAAATVRLNMNRSIGITDGDGAYFTNARNDMLVKLGDEFSGIKHFVYVLHGSELDELGL